MNLLEKVRRVKVIKPLPDFFEQGEILEEYFDNPDHFYHENNPNPDGVGFNIKVVEDYGGFDKWFVELESKDTSDTSRYNELCNQLKLRKEENEKSIDFLISENISIDKILNLKKLV